MSNTLALSGTTSDFRGVQSKRAFACRTPFVYATQPSGGFAQGELPL